MIETSKWRLTPKPAKAKTLTFSRAIHHPTTKMSTDKNYSTVTNPVHREHDIHLSLTLTSLKFQLAASYARSNPSIFAAPISHRNLPLSIQINTLNPPPIEKTYFPLAMQLVQSFVQAVFLSYFVGTILAYVILSYPVAPLIPNTQQPFV